MLFIAEEDHLQPLSGNDNRKCEVCANRRATWSGARKTEESGTQVPMCAWCVLYAGSSWGHENRDEILMMGPTIRQAALASAERNPKVHVPELDERHRLAPQDAERLMLGVFFTSSKLRRPLGTIRRIGLKGD